MNGTPVFETRDAARFFRSGRGKAIRALDGLSLSVPRGDFLAVTGPSGCGKTTLLALLGALDRPTRGAVLFDGSDIGGASEAERSRVRRRLGIVFQQSHMIRGLPLWENVTYPLVPRGVSAQERRKIAAALLERVGIESREGASPEELSGGERQRVGIARALAGDPEVLLVDEPTSDLDRETGEAVVALFRDVRAAGKTVVVATHDPALEALATSQCRLRDGRLSD
ncbi:MAG: ABC transporter ATP-binding protein [Planctomycetota bacterium]|jgi:putative ABC transport system ATP-binding protein